MPHKLLLADDSVTIQRVIELTFADEDIRVIAVATAARRSIASQTDPPDIVLADVGMPESDGYEVAAFVKGTPARAHPGAAADGCVRADRRGPRPGGRVRRRPGEAVRAADRHQPGQGPDCRPAAGAEDPAAALPRQTRSSRRQLRPSPILHALLGEWPATTTSSGSTRRSRRIDSQRALACGQHRGAPAGDAACGATAWATSWRTGIPNSTANADSATPPRFRREHRPGRRAVPAPRPSPRPGVLAGPVLARRRIRRAARARNSGRPLASSRPGDSPSDDDVIDEIARRVIARLGDDSMRDAVLDTAERLVSEEIDRIKRARNTASG